MGVDSPVLYGHSVADPRRAPCVGPERLDRIAPDDFEEVVRAARGFGEITLDDGYADNLDVAVPIAEAYGLPITVFVTTGYIARSHVPMERVVGVAARSELLTDDYMNRVGIIGPFPEGPEARYEQVRRSLRNMGRDRRSAYVTELMDCVGLSAHSLLAEFLTPAQVAELDAHPLVTVGAHGVSHANLVCVDDDELVRELVDSRAMLMEWLERDVNGMSYPYGSHDRRVRRAVKEAGYRRAYGTEPRRLREWLPVWSRMAVPRYRLETAGMRNGHHE